jgi:hypothetical protein
MLQLSHRWGNISGSHFTGGEGGVVQIRSNLFFSLFNNAISKSVYVALVTDSELDMVLKAAIMACFNILQKF